MGPLPLATCHRPTVRACETEQAAGAGSSAGGAGQGATARPAAPAQEGNAPLQGAFSAGADAINDSLGKSRTRIQSDGAGNEYRIASSRIATQLVS